MPGRTGRNDKLVPGMRVYAEDQWNRSMLVKITAVFSDPTLNIHGIDAAGEKVILNIWQITSTAPRDETPEEIDRWLNA